MDKLTIKICRVKGCEDLSLPRYMTPGASGMDLFAAVNEPVAIPPKGFEVIPLGIRVEIPEGYEAQIRPRSGLAAKHGIGILNSPGTIDSDYRGEVKVILFNFGKEDFIIRRGDRIAQMIISKVIKAELIESSDLETSSRNDGGFGHTGV